MEKISKKYLIILITIIVFVFAAVVAIIAYNMSKTKSLIPDNLVDIPDGIYQGQKDDCNKDKLFSYGSLNPDFEVYFLSDATIKIVTNSMLSTKEFVMEPDAVLRLAECLNKYIIKEPTEKGLKELKNGNIK